MPAAVKFFQFVEYLAEGVINFATDQLVFALTNAANPPAQSNTVRANLTEIAYTNLSTRNITTSSSVQTSGVYKLILADLVLSASGGSVAPFRYLNVYDDTPTSPADPLICSYDYGVDLTLGVGEALTADFDGTAGFLTLT